jgi:hypothetical protein
MHLQSASLTCELVLDLHSDLFFDFIIIFSACFWSNSTFCRALLSSPATDHLCRLYSNHFIFLLLLLLRLGQSSIGLFHYSSLPTVEALSRFQDCPHCHYHANLIVLFRIRSIIGHLFHALQLPLSFSRLLVRYSKIIITFGFTFAPSQLIIVLPFSLCSAGLIESDRRVQFVRNLHFSYLPINRLVALPSSQASRSQSSQTVTFQVQQLVGATESSFVDTIDRIHLKFECWTS